MVPREIKKLFHSEGNSVGVKRQHTECEILARCMSDQRLITRIYFLKTLKPQQHRIQQPNQHIG